MKNKGMPGFVVYDDVFLAVKQLEPDDFKAIICGMHDYYHDKITPTFTNQTLNILWPVVANKLDLDKAKYQKKQQEQKDKGLRSAFKRYALENGINPQDEDAFYIWKVNRNRSQPWSTNVNLMYMYMKL